MSREETTSGKGSIIPMEDKPRNRCRKWRLFVSLGKDPKTGRYKHPSRRFNGTYTQAVEELRSFISELEGGHVALNASKAGSFGQEADLYMSFRELEGISKRTLAKERGHLNLLKRHLGYADPSKITADDIDSAFMALKNGDSPSGKKLSGTYLQNCHDTLRRFFSWLKSNKKIAHNVAKDAARPKADTKEKKALGFGEVVDLLMAIDPTDRREALLGLYVTTGARRSEGLYLRRCDVFLDECYAVIGGSVEDDGSAKPTKSERKRVVPLDADARSILKARMDWQETAFAEAGIALPPDTPVFANPGVPVMRPHSMTTWMRKNAKKLGIDGYTIHELRHTYLTGMSRFSCASALKEIAGHARLSTTDEIYIHVGMEEKMDAMLRHEARISKERESRGIAS